MREYSKVEFDCSGSNRVWRPAGVVMSVVEERRHSSRAETKNEALCLRKDSTAEFFSKNCVGECLSQSHQVFCKKSVSSSHYQCWQRAARCNTEILADHYFVLNREDFEVPWSGTEGIVLAVGLGTLMAGSASAKICQISAAGIGMEGKIRCRERRCNCSAAVADHRRVTRSDHCCPWYAQYSPAPNHRCWQAVTRQEDWE